MEPGSSTVVVRRWHRYGHDRAYVRIGDVQIGYRDLASGAIHCDQAEGAEIVRAATADLLARAQAAAEQVYVARHARTDEGPAVGPAPAVAALAPGSEMLPDQDLALNQPGEAVRAQAVALRDAAPVRTLLARVVGAKTDERRKRIGADGEAEVGRRLEGLGREWRVLHSVHVGDRGSDIDHVAIGPGGVFVINTKHHPDAAIWVHGSTFKVNGFDQPYIRNSRFEASRSAKLLSAAAGFDVEVCGIVAVMGARKGMTVSAQPRDGSVVVVTWKTLGALLAQQPPVLGPPSIARIFDVARHLSTWRPRAVRHEDF